MASQKKAVIDIYFIVLRSAYFFASICIFYKTLLMSDCIESNADIVSVFFCNRVAVIIFLREAV